MKICLDIHDLVWSRHSSFPSSNNQRTVEIESFAKGVLPATPEPSRGLYRHGLVMRGDARSQRRTRQIHG